jgi:hypothetical protein
LIAAYAITASKSREAVLVRDERYAIHARAEAARRLTRGAAFAERFTPAVGPTQIVRFSGRRIAAPPRKSDLPVASSVTFAERVDLGDGHHWRTFGSS